MILKKILLNRHRKFVYNFNMIFIKLHNFNFSFTNFIIILFFNLKLSSILFITIFSFYFDIYYKYFIYKLKINDELKVNYHLFLKFNFQKGIKGKPYSIWVFFSAGDPTEQLTLKKF